MKNFIRILLVLGFSLLMDSCKVHKYLSTYDGSRADGTITMFYEYNSFETPIVHWEEAKKEAVSKCRNWGYSGADFFGTGIQKCIGINGYGNCNNWRVFYKCQCTGKKD